jgi:hypothetical protein
MDSIKKFTEGENNSDTSQQQSSDQTNSAAGGGRETKNGVGLVEKGTSSLIFPSPIPVTSLSPFTPFPKLVPKPMLEQTLINAQCKGIDLVEEKLLGQDTHDNEFAAEQAKDAQISEFVEDQLKSATGKGTPI